MQIYLYADMQIYFFVDLHTYFYADLQISLSCYGALCAIVAQASPPPARLQDPFEKESSRARVRVGPRCNALHSLLSPVTRFRPCASEVHSEKARDRQRRTGREGIGKEETGPSSPLGLHLFLHSVMVARRPGPATAARAEPARIPGLEIPAPNHTMVLVFYLYSAAPWAAR